MPRKIAAGNWKMNGLTAALSEAGKIAAVPPGEVSVIICPPATLLAPMSKGLAQSHLSTGGQDCHVNASGAHTGDVAAAMLADAGAAHVILGHSERRTDHAATDKVVCEKVKAAWNAGLNAIVCIGETEAERDAGQTLDVVLGQLAGSVPDGADTANTVIAYEPVWAIGTGRTASPDEIAEVHAAIRSALAKRFGPAGDDISILYGGSVKAGNAAEIFAVPHVNGALVGGASLTAEAFGPIITALDAA